MIRKFLERDIDKVMEIWLNTNISAHNFIEADYWKNNYDEVKAAIQNAEVYIYENDEKIKGFIGVVDNYIAGLFVEQAVQSAGIGTELLSHLKLLKSSLVLNVYEKNKLAVDFYKKHGFVVSSVSVDESTGYKDYEMVWESDNYRN